MLSSVVLFGITIIFVTVLSISGKQTSFVILRGCEALTTIHNEVTARNIPDCSKMCAAIDKCRGFNYLKDVGGCQFFNKMKTRVRGHTFVLSNSISIVYKHEKKEASRVFYTSAGSNDSALDVWYGRGTWSTSSYRSPLLGCWERLGITEVTFTLNYKGSNVTSKTINFDGRMSSKTSWFTSSRLLSSDLIQKGSATNIFSIDGTYLRQFFINAHYGGCPNDHGWVVIIPYSNANAICTWQRSPDGAFPYILSAKGNRAINWNSDDRLEASNVSIYIHSSLLHN